MFNTSFRRSALATLSLALGALAAGCGGGQDPILGSSVTQAVLVPPAGAIVPPVVAPVPPSVSAPPVVPPPGTCPVTVTFTDPTNGNQTVATSTTGVAAGGKRVTATLSGTVNGADINANSFRLAQTGQPPLTPASVGYDATTRVAALVTSAALVPATDYVVVFDPSGAAATPGCAYIWTFKTAPVAASAPSPVSFGAAGSFALAATAGAANTAATVINGDVVLNPTATCNAVPVGASGTFGLCGGAAPSVNGTVVTPTYPNTIIEMPNFATDSSAVAAAPERPFKASIAHAAYEEAGIGPEDLSLAEVYDLSAALELDWYENIGLCAPGDAEKLLNDGDTTIGGRVPVNPSGGLSCFGEAVPAQALAQVCEVVWQLRGQADGRQVENAKVGITANQGLFGHGSSVLLST